MNNPKPQYKMIELLPYSAQQKINEKGESQILLLGLKIHNETAEFLLL
jgi:hypothetical protein